MPFLQHRAVQPYEPGDNATDVIINQVHFNRTALDYYNYTLFSNGTLSNGSDCYLAFQDFKPHMFWENGTFVNGTSCYAPVHPISSHASVGLAFAALFVVSILCSSLNLRKHGRSYLPYDARWRPAGRRAKWYWLLFVASCGTISCFMSIDVDRGYLQGAPLIMQSIFYTLLTPGIMAAVWEGVRNWGAWQERIIFDRDPYAFTKPSSRIRQEIALPILFYLCAVINVFLTVPRPWSPIEHQRSPEQEYFEARPSATDTRWRSAGFVALAGVLITCYSLEHSIYRYRTSPTTLSGQLFFYLTAAPSQFLIALALLSVKIGYAIAASFDWSISPLNAAANPGWLYGLGYTPVLLILIIFNICGYCDLNEDKVIISIRDEIDAAVASETAIDHNNTPWWKGRKNDRRFVPSGYNNNRDRDHHREGTDHYLELGIVQRKETEGGSKDGEVMRITTAARTNSHTSESSGVVEPVTVSEPERTGHHMEYVVQPGNLARASLDEIQAPRGGRSMSD